MIFRVANQKFILANNDSLLKRMSIFVFTVVVWWASEHYLRPMLGGVIKNIRVIFGDNPFLQHVFSMSLPVDIVCLCLFFVYLKAKIIPMPQIKQNLKVIFKEGLVWGLLVCVPAITLALSLGYHLGFNPNWLSILGNVFSNSYEEFTYRVFLFSVAAYAFKNIWVGILISAFLFAMIHTQYPTSMQIVVGIAGICLSLAYVRSGSILAAILGHEVADMILDSILIQ